MTLPLFQGARLVQAREARQWTATALAERVGASSGAVSLWEKGSVQPRPQAREELARALEMPETFFSRPVPATSPTMFRFRSLSSATKRARQAAQVRAQWLHEITTFLASEIDLPRVDVPELETPRDPQLLTTEEIELAAEATRRAWGLRDGPIPDLSRLLESRGIIFARIALNAAQLDGLSTWSADGRPYILLNSEKASSVRSRFDAAHELGHLILHRHAPIRVDSPMHKLLEKQAHLFASAFIFPRSAVGDEVAYADLEALLRLKERWGLSIAAQVFRLFQLGFITEARKEHLYRQIGARGWRTKEPLDDRLVPERASVLKGAYQLLCEGAGWAPMDLQRALPFAEHDHEQLAGLPARWMKEHEKEIGELVTLKQSPPATGEPPSQGGGTVISFPRHS